MAQKRGPATAGPEFVLLREGRIPNIVNMTDRPSAKYDGHHTWKKNIDFLENAWLSPTR
jgi:hypothetical protein